MQSRTKRIQSPRSISSNRPSQRLVFIPRDLWTGLVASTRRLGEAIEDIGVVESMTTSESEINTQPQPARSNASPPLIHRRARSEAAS